LSYKGLTPRTIEAIEVFGGNKMTNEQNKSITIQTCTKRSPQEFKTTVRIEAEAEKPISKVLNVSAMSKIISREVIDADTLIQGETNVSILYLSEDGSLENSRAEVTWQEKVPNLGASTILCKATIVDYDILGFDLEAVTVNILHNLELSEIEPCEVGVNFDESVGLEKDTETYDLSKVVGANNASFLLSEEWELGKFSDAKILARNATITMENTFAGIDVVTVEGIINFNFLIFDGEKVQTVKKNIPFKNELECFGANPGNIVSVDAKVVKIMAGIRESDDKSSIISVDAEMEAIVFVNELSQVSIVKDCFSAVQDTTISAESVQFNSILNSGYLSSDIDLSASLEGKLGVDEVIGVINPQCNISSISYNKNLCEVEGVITLTVVYNNNEENNTQSFEAVCPFIKEISLPEDFNMVQDISIVVDSYKLKAGNEIQISVNLSIKAEKVEKTSIVYVSNVEYLDNEKNETAAIKVYTVKDGERIFDIAKNLGITVSNLLSQNPDLESGVVAGEKVYVYVPLVVNF